MWQRYMRYNGLQDLEPFQKIFYTFFCKNFPGKITDKYMENLKQALEKFKHSNGPQNLLVKSFAV